MPQRFAKRFQKTEHTRAVALVQPKVPLLILTAPLTLLVLAAAGSSFCETIIPYASHPLTVPNSVGAVSEEHDATTYEVNQLCGLVAHLQARVSLSPTHTIEVNGTDVARIYQHASMVRLKLLDRTNHLP